MQTGDILLRQMNSESILDTALSWRGLTSMPPDAASGIGGQMNPRLDGIEEHHQRARMFLDEARASSDKKDRFRRLMASIYFARAIVELMLEAATRGQLRLKRDEVERELERKLRHYHLVEKIRIHDFHRFGVIERDGVFLGGPMKLRPRKGTAAIRLTPHGRVLSVTGDSRIDEQRPLEMAGDQVFDGTSRRYLPLDQVLDEYLQEVPAAIRRFREGFGTLDRSEPLEDEQPDQSASSP